MKIRKFPKRDNKMLKIDLTPLIDVVFLLLIFFMVSTSFIDMNAGVKVDLPNSSIKDISKIKEIIVSINKEREIFVTLKNQDGKVDKENVKKERLEEILSINLQKIENKNVIINADKSLDHGMIVEIMSIIKKSGASSLDIAAQYVE